MYVTKIPRADFSFSAIKSRDSLALLAFGSISTSSWQSTVVVSPVPPPFPLPLPLLPLQVVVCV